ncbi:tryptophan--tRNA ligase [Proteus mirabilis]|uniref:tryptophan--tRNA ligase n=1 Tax=Proteus mirabilis TaxID=584 RepID=UPI00209C9133|nr:tryptophan--tRNA ligase [Proteus mirabilis]UTA56607.1 tryptophan--tRNA ligase [Proteus mirabilis]UTA59927.1 tryptophan--tRNA ligase [Proteus mirabilis]UTA63250.1 tryptophan--tRNA ligase [Proteus mirabilis]
MNKYLTENKSIVLTGDRITGSLHLGHYIGSLQQRVEFQKKATQYILMADMQGLTDNGSTPEKVSKFLFDVVADYLAVGIDPKLSTLCLQSALPALSELTMLYLNIVTVSRLERNPTVKHEILQKNLSRSLPAGFLTYPVSQAADITAFSADIVPAGEDQLPMIEQTNEIVTKINSLIGQPVLTSCKVVVGQVGRLPGTDGSGKMSKSLGNTINLSSTADEIKKAVYSMYTDPQHIDVASPGHIEGNVVFTYLDAFCQDKAMVTAMKAHYQRGGLGDMKCKAMLNDILQELLQPIREKRAQLINDKAYLLQVIKEGSDKAKEVTQQKLDEVKRGLGLLIL